MSRSFLQRMVGAARLQADVYEEVEADKGALGQAVGVVVLYGIAVGIGSAGYAGIGGIIAGIIAAIVGWFIWAGLTWLIGTKMLPEPQTRSNMGELLRTIGFSSSPGILCIFGLIPGIGVIIVSIASIWMLVAMVVAVRQALDYRSTWRAVGVCVIGWIVQVVIRVAVLSAVLGIAGTGGAPV